jgi:hypothetical protein
MAQLVVEIPEGLVKELEAYKGNLGEVLALGLRQIRMQQALVLFRGAGVSLCLRACGPLVMIKRWKRSWRDDR